MKESEKKKNRSSQTRHSPPDNGKVNAESYEPTPKYDDQEWLDTMIKFATKHGGEVASRFVKAVPPPK